jgi:acyl-CoA thioesterase FadM
MKLGRTKFETELRVRPDDIDMNQHVHSSRYFDYTMINLRTGRAEPIPAEIREKYAI